MRRLTILLVLTTTACAGGGSWPSLARRPVEGPRPVGTTGKCAAAATPSCLPPPAPAAAAVAAPPLSPPVAIDDVAARLAVIDRDLGDAGERLTTQRAAAASAAAAARGSRPDSQARAKAELEQTALDRIGNQIGDIRERLDAIAGTLAAAAAGGADVTTTLLATGRLIARTTALQADYTAATAALR